MTLLLESPWPALAIGGLLLAALGIALWRLGRGWVLAAMAVVAVATVALVGLERFVVTPVEEVENTLQSVTDALERNDRAAILAAISPSATAMRARASRDLDRYVIEEARITGDLVIRVTKANDQSTAVASFIGRASGRDTRGQAMRGTIVQRAVINLRKESGRWLITDFERRDFRRSEPEPLCDDPVVPTP